MDMLESLGAMELETARLPGGNVIVRSLAMVASPMTRVQSPGDSPAARQY